MLRSLCFFAVMLFLQANIQAQLKSPDEFLGYKIGSRYSAHWKVAGYFRQAAAAMPSVMKLQDYGVTNEGRPLMVAFISSPENISNLENIRKNNLRLANLSPDKMAADENMPAIVWLSYNVHGNETSSSEAAMLTLFALLDPANTQTKAWLKNTVVVIDPCINPDGRDRYVNWFNSIAGKNYDPKLMAREHDEPWPGGRTNHYNFELNRDWAWQTQLETKQRIKLYNQWLPQVHVDYHEQFINDPYYFAPAAEPFHEVITPWQREFQGIIGKSNARYFDANGWLYYTKEFFDLFYPSYGDTYPIYNGAIGMTYEQAGHGISGAAVINDEGDTLTLRDRVMHHYTTGLSTVETASAQSSRLVKEFHKFYNDAVKTGVGDYKSYIIRNAPEDAQRIRAFLELLDRNGIRYTGTASASAKGYNYNSGRDETVNLQPQDILISALQPKSALVKVLMEPKSRLNDSMTYDISAWSVPYAYGLQAFASKEIIVAGNYNPPAAVNIPETSYGYALPWTGLQSVKTASRLLQQGVLLRYAEQPFDLQGKHFERGTILILRTANKTFGDRLWAMAKDAAMENQVPLYALSGGLVDKGFDMGSDKVHPFKAPRVVMLTGDGVNSGAAGEIWHFFDQQLDYPVTLVNAESASTADWNNIDVLIMPNGRYKFLTDKPALEAFKAWINNGGKVIALEGAVSQLASADLGVKVKKAEEEKKDGEGGYNDLRTYGDRERDAVSGSAPGSIYRVDLDPTHPLAFGYPGYYYTLKIGTRVFEFLKDGGWNVGVIKKDNQVAGFVGSSQKDKMKDAMLLGVVGVGNGSITVMADDPLFRSFWENGKLMFCNAVFLVGR
ncbi:MAG: zinc carboxypeptidase [Chitinophagaceae bacterium]|nr:zinc carboxypeptidase [Chitinophagaceae bacterium]